MSIEKTILIACLLLAGTFSFSQSRLDTVLQKIDPQKWLASVEKRAEKLQQKIILKSEKALKRLQKREQSLYNKLSRKDSLKAKEIFGTSAQQYQNFAQRLQNGQSSPEYLPAMDTLVSSLKFLQQNPQLLSAGTQVQKLEQALGKVNGLQNRFQQAEQIKRFLRERRQYLKDRLAQMGFGRELKKISKDVYYFNEQLTEYKSILKDQAKAKETALKLISKTGIFKDFMKKHSQLASLFGFNATPDPGSTAQLNLAGLQTRAQVSSLLQAQFAASGMNAQRLVRQNLQSGQGQLAGFNLRNAARSIGNGDADMPEGFTPNSQKTKSFAKRLEYGANMQSHRTSGFLPATVDMGLYLGYKLNDKSIAGIGASYKLGLGKDIKHISLSHQGIGLRSFTDWKIKGSWWITGGYELNYRTEFTRIADLENINAWQESGLIGLSKMKILQSGFLKKAKLQVLWDFLSYKQLPRTQAIVFRVGYGF